MHVTFYGAAREVTGSMHMITTNSDRILLDCGLFQGRRQESERKNRLLPFDPRIITNVILSHAHIDHSGRLPVLTRENFGGRIISTRPTADACDYLLRDSAHIQESDALYLNYKAVRGFLHTVSASRKTGAVTKREIARIRKLLKKNEHVLNAGAIEELQRKHHVERVSPLYSMSDAEKALEKFDGYPFRYPVTAGTGTVCTFYPAGHILGSAVTIIRVKEDGRRYTIGFSGDVGRFGKPILRDPTLEYGADDRSVDLMIMESTYGDREHDPVADLSDRLKEVIVETHNRGGSIIIPSFAFGRTQELIYLIHKLYDGNSVPRMPVYIDSPLAINMTRVFGEHPETYDEEAHKTFLERGENPFFFKGITYVQSVEESMALMRDDSPHIVISASGMCEAGRILHHLRYTIHDPRNTVLIVGFMARHTLGRRLEEMSEENRAPGNPDNPPVVKILNKFYPLRARVVRLGGFSAHGDKHELLRLVQESNLKIKRIAIVHGEEEQSLHFAGLLSRAGYSVTVPRQGESIGVV